MSGVNKKYPLSEPRKGGKGGTTTIFDIGLITDLDRDAKFTTESGSTAWKSLLMKGILTYDTTTKKVDVEVKPADKAVTLVSEFSRGGRGMELSELVTYNGKIYTVDDRTGIVFEIAGAKAIPWVLLTDGNGREEGGFKGEWMTVKDDKLYVGGHGRETVARDGISIVNKNYQWVKTITKEGAVTHNSWMPHYDAMRAAAGCAYPGYLTHEAGVWSEKHKQWFFLPRKVSTEAYDYKKDEHRTGNILLRCNEDFSEVKIVKIGELKHKSRGFSTFKFVPGTDETIIVAIKSEEIDDAQRSFLFVFNIDGTVLMDDKEFTTTMKVEGIEFM